MDTFKNQQVDVSDLPKVEDLIFQPLERRYRTVLIIGRVIFSIISSSILFFAFKELPDSVPSEMKYAGIGLFVLYLIWSFIATIIGFKHKSYALRQKDIIYRSGWLWKYTTTAPFKRVQHVRIDQGLIERNFNLARLKIFTAGGNSSDLSIPGLDPVTADELKEFIVKKTLQDEEE